MKQVEIEVDDSLLPIDIYDILYTIAPEGFIERENVGHSFILFVEEDNLEDTVKKLEGFSWVKDIKIGKSVEEDGWLKNWKEEYKPIVVPPFKIIPAWYKDSEPVEGFIPLYINSGIAFGTGEHETTQLCLRLLSEIDVENKTILDIGTGSGILAIAASKLGAKEVYAFDLDPVAVEVAGENVKINGVDNIYLFEKDALKYKGPRYDVIMANLVWSILSEIPHSLKSMLSGGYLIASGILKEQFDDFVSAYKNAGFEYIKYLEQDDWVGVLLRG